MIRDELVKWAFGARPFDDQTWVGRDNSVADVKCAVRQMTRFPNANYLLACWDAGIDAAFEPIIHRRDDGITARLASWSPFNPPGGK